MSYYEIWQAEQGYKVQKPAEIQEAEEFELDRLQRYMETESEKINYENECE